MDASDMKIYVACLASYNAGRLYGKWIELEGLSENAIGDAIEDMLTHSPTEGAEEWSIHDYEGFGDIRLGENPGLDMLASLVEMVENHGKVFLGVVAHLGTHYIEEAIETMQERYLGSAKSLEDWGWEQMENSGDLDRIPDYLYRFFNFTAYAQEELDVGETFMVEVDNTMHFFSNR